MKHVIELKRKTYEELQQTVIELITEKCLLEKALDKAIKKITLDNDEGFEHLDSQYEYWKDWLMKDE